MLRPAGLILLVTALLAPCALASHVLRYYNSFASDALPDPLSGTSTECTPGRGHAKSPVCDPYSQLALRYVHRLEQEISKVYNAKNPYSNAKCNGRESNRGYLIEIAVVHSISSTSPTSYGRDLFNRWRVGHRSECGNGVLLLIAMADQKYAFIPGYNVRLSSQGKQRFKTVLERYLQKRNLYSALLNAIVTIGEDLSDVAKPYSGAPEPKLEPVDLTPKDEPSMSHTAWYYVMSALSILVGIALMFACCNGFGGKKAVQRKKMERIAKAKLLTIKEEYQSAILPQYIPVTCSICNNSLDANVDALEELALAPQSGTDATAALTGRANLGPERRLRCGHAFHESCLEKHVPSTAPMVCPVCLSPDDPMKGPPPSLKETRDRDFSFRLLNLRHAHPDVITETVHDRLLASPTTSSRNTNYGGAAETVSVDRTGGPAWGSLAASAGIGALAGWGISNMVGGSGGNGNNGGDGGLSGTWGIGDSVIGGSGNTTNRDAGNGGGWFGGDFSGGWTGGDAGGDSGGGWTGGWSAGDSGGGGGGDGGGGFSGGW